MKRFLILFALLFALAIPGAAQSLCTITGTLYDSTGAACNGCRLTISRARSGSTPLSQGSQPVVANGSGAVSFTAVQGSFITLTGPFTIGRYNLAGGLEFYVPLQSSATLATLQTAEDALNALISSTTYAPADIPVITKIASSSLSNEFALGSLATGILKNTTTTGVPTIAIGGTDYEFPLTFAARLNRSTNTIDLANSGVTAGSCTSCDLTIDAYGRVTAKANGSGGGGTVSSVFGRTGAVVAQANDYTFAQLASKPTTLSGYGITDAQPLSSDLTAIGGLSPTNDDIIQRKAGVWTNRTVAQFKADLGLAAIATSGSASDLGTGTVPDARFPATLPVLNGSNLTALNASNLAAGTVPLARLAGITNTEISNSAAIAYSKLNLTGAILNGDLAGSIANAKLANSSITINAGTNFGITAPGSSSLGATVTIGATTDNLRFANLGLGVAAPTSGGQIAATLGANNITGFRVVRNTDTSPTGNFFDFRNAADSASLARLDIAGNLTVTSCTGCGGGGSPGGSDTQLQRNNAGAFGGISGATSDGTNVTFGSANLRATLPQFTTGIRDANGNLMLGFSPTASATESITVANNTATNAVGLTATTSTAAASTQAGNGLNVTAAPAVAGTTNAGAAAGGSVRITAGNAARLTSGNANGGSVILVDGTGIGTGVRGGFNFGGTSSSDAKLTIFSNQYSAPSLSLQNGAGTDGLGSFHSGTAGYGAGGSGSLEIAIVGASGGRITVGGGAIGFASSSAAGIATLDGNRDTEFTRAAARVMSVGNGTAGHTVRFLPDSPAQITADQNNYQAGSGRSYFYRLSSDASRNITGLNPAGGTNQNGEVHLIVNVGSFNIVLVNESASSTAGNRFTNSTGADITLAANEAALVMYDGTSSRWRVFKQ